MAVVFRMMLGVIYLLRKNFVCFVFSFRCVMVVSYFKKGVCYLLIVCYGWDYFILFIKGGFSEKRNFILLCMFFKGENIILKNGFCMESCNFYCF